MKLSGRVGISFENKKKAQQISIDDIRKPEQIEEEVISMDGHLQPLYSSLITISDDDDVPPELEPVVPSVVSSTTVTTKESKEKKTEGVEFINVDTTVIEKARLKQRNPRAVWIILG